MIKELGSYIASQCSLTMGTNLFVGHLPVPEQPASAPYSTLLERTPGRRDTGGSEIDYQPVQVWTRGATYFTARAQAMAIFQALVNQAGMSQDGVTFSVTGGRPAFMGTNETGEFEFTTNLLVAVKE